MQETDRAATKEVAVSRLFALVAAAVLVLAASPSSSAAADEGGQAYQPYSVPVETLDAALDCTDLTANPDKEPVLLVHGTFTAGHEQYDWNYAPLLTARGFDHCIVTYPNRGLDDMQVSAEYVARAMEVMHEQSGRKVDVMGHSQGALLPRWAVKWFPQASAAADDLVLVAGPNHGTAVAQLSPGGPISPAVFYQFSPDSNFTEALNRGDETPGDIDYTSLYSTLLDELVQPDGNIPGQTATAILGAGKTDPRVANVTPQQLCPGRLVDHLTIGTIDLVSIDIVLDAFTHDGPADLSRLDPLTTCAQGVLAQPDQLPGFLALLEGNTGALPEFNSADGEPPLMPYARAAQDGNGSNGSGNGSNGSNGSGNGSGNDGVGDGPGVDGGIDNGQGSGGAGSTLPKTGGTSTALLGLLFAGCAALLRGSISAAVTRPGE